MRKNKNMIAAVMLSVAVLALVLRAPIGAAAAGQRIQDMAVEPPSGEVTYSLSGISSRQVGTYAARAVYYNSVALGNISRVINGTPYVAIRAFVEGIGAARVSYSAAARTITLSGNGHNVSVSDGAYALYANGRVFFSSSPSVILSDGRMYVPAAVLARALSLTVEPWSGGSVRLVGTARAVVSGAKYYADDAVYWLSRIISAEARGESLRGKMAVGNVVLNRVRSTQFPNTIYGVIFDKKYGVQFAPTANGTIYHAPTEESIIAAKMCLEGYSISNTALYFFNPRYTSGSWVRQNRE
jgi:N-acetylmuramoyl-L-alanine amidase